MSYHSYNIGLALSGNYSILAIPAAWILAMIPGAQSVITFNSKRYPGQAEYDMTFPDGNYARKDALPAHDYGRYARARGAHSNSLVSLPFFAGAMIIGNVARLSTRTLNGAAAAYLALRALYVYLYVNGTNNTTGERRALTWTAANVVCCVIYGLAGWKMRYAL